MEGRRLRYPIGEVIAATAMNAALTFEVERELINEAWGLALVYVTVTDADNSETGVSMDCTASEDENTTDYRVPACVWDAVNVRFNCEAGPAFWNPSDETSPKRQLFRFDIEGLDDFECTFTPTGGAAGDTLEADLTLTVKG
jgi:hypothetical protein